MLQSKESMYSRGKTRLHEKTFIKTIEKNTELTTGLSLDLLQPFLHSANHVFVHKYFVFPCSVGSLKFFPAPLKYVLCGSVDIPAYAMKLVHHKVDYMPL